MTRDDFTTAYAAALTVRGESDPEYAYLTDPAAAAHIAARMVAPLAAGTADVHGSPILRALARRFGIAHTVAGWRLFAASLAD